ncbi:hypothetical protein [Pseudomonas fluorescens]|uniref:Uncharacterized protein n=1 Tax=Pseudomonas fluorescens TaxID=294 RepID=A0A5E7DZL6_PSEFL|nr:hypothetical protein [Pseudomonas fluorescens]VVO18745.1 hypothetical protein PS691_04015 [Pseudomonas fluorescens]
MFDIFRRKTFTQKALGRLKPQCLKAHPADQIQAGLIVDVINSGFMEEFGNLSEFCKRPKSEQGQYLTRLSQLQDHAETKLGADLFGLWVIAAQASDMQTQGEAAEIMARFSRLANGVKP